MAQVRAGLANNSGMPVASVTMCEEAADSLRVDISVCESTTESVSVVFAPAENDECLSAVTDVDYPISSPDSGHGTSQEGQPEEAVRQLRRPKGGGVHGDANSMANVGRNNSAEGYPWINGQPSVLEPVAINPETGFATVLVDASAMAGYPQGPIPATWPHNAFPIPTTHLHPHPPPPHFLHPHAYEMPATNDYGYMAGYDSIHAPHYDNVSPMYDPSIHLTANGSHGYCQKGPNGRNHRNSRGSSLSPKRPNNRSASLNNGTAQRRGANATSTGGRFTPSPSSGGSRGSSPGQTRAQPLPPQAAINPTTNTASVATGPMTPGQHVVHLHVNPGETVSLQMGGQVQVIQGRADHNYRIFSITLPCVRTSY